MEPVTHVLTGICLARAGPNRRAAYATLAMAAGAEFPDIDTLWSFGGPVVGFQHHRGMTHTFLGVPIEALLILGGVYGVHRWRVARARRALSQTTRAGDTAAGRSLTSAPVRWGLLYGFTVLALLSHLWLDFTNNYGLRPFFPFNPRWYAASITFIFDPWMFLLLLLAVALPPLFRLIGAEVGARRPPFAARGWSIAALLGVAVLWSWRLLEHSRAEQMVLGQSYALSIPPDSVSAGIPPVAAEPLPSPPPRILPAIRAQVSPDPINPFRWYSVTDFGPLLQLGTVDLRAGTLVPEQPIQNKPMASPELAAAEATLLGRVYLDWSPLPFLSVQREERDTAGTASDSSRGKTVVTFRDPRFLGNMRWLHSADHSPLTGSVVLDEQRRVLTQTMDGKVQH